MISELYIQNAKKNSYIENTFPVYEWEVEGVQYWPVLKNIIFFESVKKKSLRSSIKDSLLYSIYKDWKTNFSKLSRISYSKKCLNHFEKLSETQYLFSGAQTYIRNKDSKNYNMYFDPIMDQLEISNKDKSFYINYSNSITEHAYRKDRVFDIHKYYPKYHRSRTKKLKKSKELVKQLDIVCGVFSLNKQITLNKLLSKLESILSWKDIWLNVLSSTKSKISFGICYYNEPMYGLLLASREKNIPFVDMQHGGQGDLHPAYSFSNVPNKGCNTLPNCFWVWDNNSKKNIDKWCNNSQHFVINGGNPWIEHLRFRASTLAKDDKKKIICTLTIGLKSILPDYILNSIINSSDEFIWYLRFHPRTKQKDKNQLYRLIDKYGISNKIEFIDANNIQLPELLADAWAHVSYSSGSHIEAALMGVRNNIITSEIGLNNHSDLIKSNKAFYYNPEEESVNLIDFIMKLNTTHSSLDVKYKSIQNYKYIINEIFNSYNQAYS